MISINDIYFKMNSSILSQGFFEANIEKKKMLIDLELKKYIISKIQETNKINNIIDASVKELEVPELLQFLADLIPQKQHFNTLSHFIHYIIQVVGNIQGYSIIWFVEGKEELIDCSIIEYDKIGIWTSLKTHENPDYIKIFKFVYDVFNNNFMKEDFSKRLILRSF